MRQDPCRRRPDLHRTHHDDPRRDPRPDKVPAELPYVLFGLGTVLDAETACMGILAGAFATAAGSSLVDAKSIKEKDWAAITARAKAIVAAGVK